MDWPTAAVVLGTLGTITAAIIKVVPQRTIVQNSDGHKCASEEDIEKQNIYMHQRFHDVLDKMSPMSNNTFALVERTNDLNKSNARIENKLAILLDRYKRGDHGSIDDV